MTKQLTRAVRSVLTVLLLTTLVYVIGWRELLETFKSVTWWWLAPMYAATLVGLMANAALSRALFKTAGLHVTLTRVLLANTLSTFYTLILPSDALAGIAKWADLSAATGNRPKVLTVLVLAKLWLSLPPLVLGVAVLTAYSPLASRQLTLAGGLTLLIMLSAMSILLNGRIGPVVDRWLITLVNNLPERASIGAAAVIGSLSHFRGARILAHLKTLGYSAGAFFAGIAGFACAARAAGANAPLSALIWLSMTLFVTRLVPITFSNLGVREAVLVFGLGVYGVPAANSMAVGIVMFTNTLFIAFAGLVYQIALLRGWINWREAGMVGRLGSSPRT